nr:T9SS type A sorting domain-containing protein [uncultured Flavobacterium sp.]
MKKFYFLVLALGLFNGVSAQNINFPDVNFKSKLLQASPSNQIAKDMAGNWFKIDANNDAQIQVSEALAVKYLNVNNIGNSDPNLYITNLEGLDFFSNLEHFDCTFNRIVSYDFSSLVHLIYLSVTQNPTLNSVNVDGLVNLVNLQCMGSSALSSLDLSSCRSLSTFSCSGSGLQYVNLKNGANETSMNFNSNLVYLCVDDTQEAPIISNPQNYGLTNCNINTYCSFVPGGPFYTMQGNASYDLNSNGCDVSDLPFPDLKIAVTRPGFNRVVVFNSSGHYSLPVQAGTFTVTPVLENPTYFNVSPLTVNITFPTQSSPLNQNFCVTANGAHPDLEITLLPTTPARPGFDAVYKLIYKNIGNQTQSGSVTLRFNDWIFDFVSASPAISSQIIDAISWDFTNLMPFESREVTATLNLNSPTETPPVNGGDRLTLYAEVSPFETDETPENNLFGIKQLVVNSFDPNDKTCLQGATIAPSEVGKYLHYMIRFENTGTFPAENIVVKDMIDTAKFDIATLVPIKGSHSFVTNITGNKVEFIFENINLPFDDANNDGYVAFKIKTKPTLVNGDTFSNTANIYFDYNFPIVTNTATTTIAALSNQDFGFSSYFMLYPNPVNDVLTLETKQTIEVSSINIYNQLGQLVLVVPKAQNVSKVDISGLASGNYFIKVNSDKGTSNTKFVKK